MSFIDEINIYVSSGKGGNGLVSFSKKKFSRFAVPDGGNGGNGGNVYFLGDKNYTTFFHLRFRSNYKAEDGFNGKSNGKTGKNGCNLFIKVPLGTLIYDCERGILLGEVIKHGDKILIVSGGISGYGNFFLKQSSQLYNKIRAGGNARLKYLHLELKLLANVGLLGLPNVGKSLFVNSVSDVFSKVGDYNFTTLKPKLGLLKDYVNKNIIIADIPGLIRFSSKGMGLGFNFLKHLSKTVLLLHFIDLSIIKTKKDILRDIIIINRELKQFDSNFLHKEKWLILNKNDLIIKFDLYLFSKSLLKKFNYRFVFSISSKKKYSLKKLSFNIGEYFSKYY